MKNYKPETMSFAGGYLGPKGDVGFTMVYSETKMREAIEKLLSEGQKIKFAVAGLDGDWGVNSSVVYDENGFKSYILYDRSQWAIPILIVTFEDGSTESFEVWNKK